MRRVALGAALAASLLGACTFSDGRGWATLRASARGELHVDEAPVSAPPARFVTDQDATLTLTTAAAEVTALQLLEASTGGGGSGGTFDPTNPPAGYSNCHAGHCHTADGNVESFEEIAAKMAGGEESTLSVAEELPADGTLSFLGEGTLALGAFETDSVQVGAVALVLAQLRFEGTVAVGGEELALTVLLAPPSGIAIQAPIDVALGRDGEGSLTIALAVPLEDTLFDGIRFQNLDRDGARITIDATHNPAVEETLMARLATLTGTVERASDDTD